jgi:uncharacterized MAPEG superfamily protein
MEGILMANGLHSPAFIPYAVTCLVLSFNLTFLWLCSGVARFKAKLSINPEDAAQFRTPLGEFDPPEVARALRAHTNAQAASVPFLLLGLVYVLAGGPFWIATVIFAIFVAARLAHAVFYLRAVQPWRTFAFQAGALATLALMAALIWQLWMSR